MDFTRITKRTICIALVCLVLIIIGSASIGQYNKERAEERYLDAEELHYDADGPFILIDRETSQMGYYDANTPIWHLHSARIRPDFKPHVYRVHKAQNGLYFVADNCGIPVTTFVLTLTDAELENFKDMPDWIPALVR